MFRRATTSRTAAPRIGIILKVILLGDHGVGKTSLVKQYPLFLQCQDTSHQFSLYVDKSFNHQFKPTINADFLTKELQIEGKLVALQIWDTPGREKFHNLALPYYRGADGCVLVFDINSKKSFEALDKWYSLFMDQDHNKFPFLLPGNKIDADRGVLRQVSDKAAIDWCVAKLDIPYYETSAKEGCNIEAAFLSIAKTALASQHEKHTTYFTASSSKPAYEHEQRRLRGRWFCCYY